ncbi:MAG: PQQ-dependent sugar dehydrogenase [Deltaproteobacteria bacterium]|nr:PQQ-dependent sugar dehydrogenase [Deltaproteobacteria bacterium]
MRAPKRAFLFTGIVAAGAAALAAAAACSEQLPAELTSEAPESGSPWGLETRPSAPSCATLKSEAKIGFEKVATVPLTAAVLVVVRGDRFYTLEQGGVIRTFGEGATTASVVADLTTKVNGGGESGLLGMAFHPKFDQNGFVYLYFTRPHPTQPPPPSIAQQQVIARYQSKDGGLTLDLSTEKILWTLDDPFGNHNGGTLEFGNDGFLYFANGDGGGGGDPMRAGQDKGSLFGKILRFDVDGGDPYAIPATNPFASGGGRPEIYALGFRNPFRFFFDRPTGDLWVADVGQGAWEELDKVVLGGNYGWNVREGKHCYSPASGCDASGLIDPVVEHGRSEARSIIAGAVYRGTKVPSIANKLVYADVVTSFFFAIDPTQASPTPIRLDQDLPRTNPSSFALDKNGEVVFTALGQKAGEGAVMRIVPVKAANDISRVLGETGCVDPKEPSKPALGLFPYDVVAPEYRDGLAARRYLSVPAAAKIAVKEGGALELPPGSVAFKTFAKGGKPYEVQMLRRRDDGTWQPYDYFFTESGLDAVLNDDTTKTCLECHTAAAGTTLGLEAAQLDRDADFGGRTGNVLATLDHVGMLGAPIATGSYRRLASLDSYDTLERRARSYLHANCANCHRDPKLDLRITTSLAATNACGPGRPILPGDPGGSPLLASMRRLEGGAGGPDAGVAGGPMPPLGRTTVDEPAARVIEDWIRSLSGCGAP